VAVTPSYIIGESGKGGADVDGGIAECVIKPDTSLVLFEAEAVEIEGSLLRKGRGDDSGVGE
jgi:hypothetical protein